MLSHICNELRIPSILGPKWPVSSFAANCMFFPVCTMFNVFFGGCKGLNSCLCLKRVTHSNVNPSLRFPRDNTICAIWRCITSKHIYSRRAHFISKTPKFQTIYSSLQWISWVSFNTNYNILHPSSKKVKLIYEKEHEFFNNFHLFKNTRTLRIRSTLVTLTDERRSLGIKNRRS